MTGHKPEALEGNEKRDWHAKRRGYRRDETILRTRLISKKRGNTSKERGNIFNVYEYKFENDEDYKTPIALEAYLDRHPEIREIHLHLDNDRVGRTASRQIAERLKGQYTIFDEPPKSGKDYNDYLINPKRKEEIER